MERRFRQLDVFTTEPMGGNPLAVVLDAEGLTTDRMQDFAAWTNLSETTFLLPPTDPGADYLVRIFTPAEELPFAGHPTLGSCRAWLDGGGEPATAGQVVQQCGAGLVTVRLTDTGLSFAAPPITRYEAVEPAYLQRLCALLKLDPVHVVDSHWIDNGPGWVGLLLDSAERVSGLATPSAPGEDHKIGLIGFHADSRPGGESGVDEPAVEIRAFFTDNTGTIREDPVTGSLNASAARWLIDSGRITAPYLAAQGAQLGRVGRIHVEHEVDDETGDDTIWVGGSVVTLVVGTVDLG